MPIQRSVLSLAVSVFAVTTGWAGLITEPTRLFTVGVDIPDLQDPPLSFLQTVTDSAIVSLTRVEVGLRLVGHPVGSGFASEMFVSLNKDLALTSILLNQAGTSDTDGIGAYYDGWDVTFADAAASGDIHLASPTSGVLAGTWQPDGRILPTDTLRPLLLSVFAGGPGNGDWWLSVADLELGGAMRLESWSLTLAGDDGVVIVPEVGQTLPLFCTALLALHLGGRRASKGRFSRRNDRLVSENSGPNVTVEMPGITQLGLQFRGRTNQNNEDANVNDVRVVAHEAVDMLSQTTRPIRL